MKKTLAIMLALSLVVAMMPLAVSAAEEDLIGGTFSQGLHWTLDKSTWVLSISGTQDMTDYYYVPWRDYKDQIVVVEFEQGVCAIRGDGFSSLTNLERVSIPDSVSWIGEAAFYGCTKLEKVHLPDSVFIIDSWAFASCTGLKEINIPSVADVRQWAFRGCTGLEEIRIPAPVSPTGDEFFPNFGKEVFLDCTGLKTVTIEEGFEILSEGMFKGCTALTEITLPESVREISWYCFEGCSSLNNIMFGSELEVIGSYAFKDCASLAYLTIPASVTKIDRCILQNCKAMQEVYFQGSAPEIDSFAFASTGFVAYYSPDDPTWNSETMLRYGSDSSVVWAPYGHVHEYTPSGREATCEVFGYTAYTCAGCGHKYVEYHSALGHNYVNGVCTRCYLKDPEWDGSAASSSWGSNIDWKLTQDGTLIISGQGEVRAAQEGVTGYPWYPYAEQITNVIFEEGVSNVPDSAFNYYYPNIVSAELKSVEIIDYSAFNQCTAMTSVTLPDTLKEIRNGAFCYTALESIDIPDGVTLIGISAFAYSTLPEIILPDGLLELGDSVFSGCQQLKTAYLPDSLTEIGMGLFLNCTALETANIPANLTIMPDAMFSGCASLKEIEIPDGIEYMYMSNFQNSGLVSVTIPASVKEMVSPFGYCKDLKEITFLGDAPEMMGGCFRDVTATAYYPADNATWTAEVMQNYGGTITWVPYSNGPEVVASGTWGDNSTWKLTQDGTLIISGEGEVAESADANYPWTEYADRILKVIFEEGVTNVPAGAFFYRYSNLASVELKSVEVIEPEAFGRCEALTSVMLPDTLNEIGKRAFMQCTALDSLELNEGLEIIGQEAFSVCHALSGTMTIPGTVTQIGSGPFDFTGITDVYFLGDMPQIDEYTFSAVDITVHYPGNNDTWTAEKIEACKGIATWIPYGEASEPTAKIISYSTSLGGNIAMNFYVELSEDLVADPDAYIQFSFAGKTVNVPLSEGVLSGTSYRFACPITSKNMTDDITAQVYNAKGPVGDPKTMAVDTYCNWIIANTSDQKTINLMKAMLNYGASAQMLFGYRTDTLANAALADADKAFGKVDASAFAHNRTGEEDGIKPISYTLLLDSETTVRCYFELTGDKPIDEFTFMVDGVEVTPTYKDGYYYIEKANIAAHRLDDMHTFTCGNITITYGGLSYVNQVMTYYTSGTTFDMASALYAYSKAAEAYIG